MLTHVWALSLNLHPMLAHVWTLSLIPHPMCARAGLYAYSSGCLVVLEDLSNGFQRYLSGHTEEISTLALQHDSAVLASASSPSPSLSTPAQIRIWSVASAKCRKV